ncbi:MAG: hypothetical protein WCI25_03225 [Actinomycetes bacterium]|jgi:hypothetical protein
MADDNSDLSSGDPVKRAIALTIITITLFITSWGSATAQCTSNSCLTVSTDADNSDVVATVIKRALAGINRTVTPVVSVQEPVSRCDPPVDFPGICAPPVVRKPSPLTRESVREHVPDLLLTLEPVDAIVGLPINAYLRPLPAPFTLLVGGFTLYITLIPSVQWNFGDGAERSGTLGGPYPSGSMVHTFRTANRFRVSARVLWKVSAVTSEGEEVEVTGDAIVLNYARLITVRAARGHLISTSSKSRP